MSNAQREIIVIPAAEALSFGGRRNRQMRVASYSRVSTDFEEQLTSFHAQKSYYTDLIMRTPQWTLAGTYADAAAIIGLNQKPEANGRRFSPFSLVSAHFKANGGCNCLI